jgi:hypothetical protein
MKKALLLSLIVLFFGSVQAQSNNQLFNDIANSFRQNNDKLLSNKFAQTLDLTIGDTDGTYSKQHASVLIKKFFTSHQIASFTIKHQGSSNNKTHYAVCYLMSGDKSWRVYILLDNHSEIIQLQIEE